MRYSGGVYDIRKKCYSSFSGDTCPNFIVYNNVGTPILASSGQNELGKKSKEKTWDPKQLLFCLESQILIDLMTAICHCESGYSNLSKVE